jgi:cell wall-associated NlpC family hydrolase
MVLLKRMVDEELIEIAEDGDATPKILVSAASAGKGTGGDILALAERHLGETYVFGASANFQDPNFAGPWDCADFTSWVLYQATGLVFGCTDDAAPTKKLEPFSGAWLADTKAKGQEIPVASAKKVPGAFFIRKAKGGKPGHVAVSDGQGKTIEAMGAAFGVARGKVDGRFDTAVLVAGVKY